MIRGIISSGAETEKERLREKKVVKIHRVKKESTAEYITQRQLFQGYQRSDSSSGTLSRLVNGTGGATLYEKKTWIRSCRMASAKSVHIISHECVLSLHHCLHIYYLPVAQNDSGLLSVPQEA